MASIDTLRASDGSGNASIATVQSVRSPSATTIVVDTVQGINTNFHATIGTPHTFVDPVTSETITVISEATAVDFKGHVDGGNLEIDTIAPGFVDNGSAVSDIVIIKPTTQWADGVADVLDVAHNDDGTLADDTVNTNNVEDGAITATKITFGNSADGNGWKYHNIRQTYTKRVTFSQAMSAGSGAVLTISSTNLPVGVSTLGTLNMQYSYAFSTTIAHRVNIGANMTSSSTALAFSAQDGNTETITGFIDIILSI